MRYSHDFCSRWCVGAGFALCSLLLLATSPAAAEVVEVGATVETAPVPNGGDAADDSEVWVHPTEPQASLVIGTDKKGGLAVYDLDGTELQYLADGQLNNVDVRYGLMIDGDPVDVVTAGNRTDDTIAIYTVDAQARRLVDIAGDPVDAGISIYGSCMYRSLSDQRMYVFGNSKGGDIVQLELVDDGTGAVAVHEVRRLHVDSQTEGCVADDEFGLLYVGEESKGIWKFGAEPNDPSDGTLVDDVANGRLDADVEGLTLYVGSGGDGYLIASSQGNDTYVVYERGGDNAYVGTFRIAAADGIDAVTGTDGIAVSHANLGSAFPSGVFIAQDNTNDGDHQNHKLVPWQEIAQPLGLIVDTSYDPRDPWQDDSAGDAGTADAGADTSGEVGVDAGQDDASGEDADAQPDADRQDSGIDASPAVDASSRDTSNSAAEGCACRSTDAGQPTGWWWLGVIGCLVMWRRRR